MILHLSQMCKNVSQKVYNYHKTVNKTTSAAMHIYNRVRGGSKYTIFGSNTNTIQPNQIQIHCFSRFHLKYKKIQINSHFLVKYDSNTLSFLKFDSNMIQIRGLCFHYSSSVSQWVECCVTLTRHTISKLWQNCFIEGWKELFGER